MFNYSEVNMIRIVLLTIVTFCAGIQNGPAVAQSLKRFYVADEDRAWLGVSVRDVTKKIIREKNLETREGALVSEVFEDSPAEEAGIREGDVIVRFDDRRIGDGDELVRAVRRSESGDEVKIVVDRNGETKTLTATLDKRRAGDAFAFRVPSLPRVAPVPPVAPVPRGRFYGGILSHERLAGIRMQDLGKQLGDYFEVPGKRGVLVTSVSGNSAAEKAGVRAGDVIVRVNGNTVRDVEDCFDEIRDAEEDEVSLDLIRRGKPMKVTVELEPGDRRWGDFYFDDGDIRLRDELRQLKEELPGNREGLRELKEHLRDLKENLREDIGDELRESLRDNWRDLRELRDNLRETLHEHLPLIRRVARAAFHSM